MTESEYDSLIPHHCKFPHITRNSCGDVCWSITNDYIGRVGACEHCECSISAYRKMRYWEFRRYSLDIDRAYRW